MRAAVIAATGFVGNALLVTPVRANVARPLIEGVRNPTMAHDDRIRGRLPFALTGFCDAARRALDPARESRLATR